MNEARTVREALLQQALEDIDGLIEKIRRVDSDLSEKIEQSVKNAHGKAFLEFELRYQELIRQQSKKLTETTQQATSELLGAFNRPELKIMADAMKAKPHTIISIIAITSVIAGIIGGLTVAFLTR